MSVKISAMVWDHGPEKAADRLMMLGLADRADDTGFCWPGMAELASRCCVSERTARRTIHRLADEGWLSIRPGGGTRPDGRGISNAYTLNLTKMHTRTPTTGYGSDTRTPEVAYPDAEVPDTRTPASGEPSVNHQGTASPAKRRTAWPDGFEPDADLVAWTRDKAPRVDAKYEWQQFRDHALATGRKMVDWRRAWMTWARRAEQQAADRGVPLPAKRGEYV